MGHSCSSSAANPVTAVSIIPSASVVARTNGILNRWRAIEVATLQAIYIQHSTFTVTPGSSGRHLDERAFFNVFPRIDDLNIDAATKKKVFGAFDVTGRGAVDFRDFCRGLSICAHGTRAEMFCFLFDIATSLHTTLTHGPLGELLEASFTHAHDRDSEQDNQSASAQSQASVSSVQRLAGRDTPSTATLIAVAPQHPDICQIPDSGPNAPIITHQQLLKLSKICGLTPPVPKQTYRRGRNSAASVEYSGEPLDLGQYLAFAESFIDDASLQRVLGVFSVLPGKVEERRSVMAALEDGVENMMRGGDTVYIIEESWWKQWCNFAQVEPLYDWSNYCVVSLRLTQLQSGAADNAPTRPDGIDNSLILDNVDSYSLRLELRHEYISNYLAIVRGTNDPQDDSVGGFMDMALAPSENIPTQQHLPQTILPEGDSAGFAANASIDGGSIGSSVEELQLHEGPSASPHQKSFSGRQQVSFGYAQFDEDGTIETGYCSGYGRLSADDFIGTPTGLARMPSGEDARRAFSIIPKAVWESLRGYYCGGPVVPAIVCNVVSRPLERDDGHREQHLLRGAWVDINPLMLNLSLCNASGIPMAAPNETVAFRKETVDSFISRVIANFLRQTEPPDSHGIDFSQSDIEVCANFLSHVYAASSCPKNGDETSESHVLHAVVRLWTLVYDEILHDTLEEESPSSTGKNTTAESPPTAASAVSTGVRLRHGPLSWWVLVDSSGYDRSNAASLESLPGMCNGGRVMLEVRNIRGEWPTERIIEDAEFRLFEIGDRVDARDYSGAWLEGEIIDIEWGGPRDSLRGSMGGRRPSSAGRVSNSGVSEMSPTGARAIYCQKHKGNIQQLKIHYHNYSSKWDEVFPPDSSCIAPLGSHTTPMSAVPPLPQGMERSFGWLQSHGVLGKYEAAVDMSPRDRTETVNTVDTLDGLVSVASDRGGGICGCWQRRDSRHKPSPRRINAKRDDDCSNISYNTPQKAGGGNKGTIAVLPSSHYDTFSPPSSTTPTKPSAAADSGRHSGRTRDHSRHGKSSSDLTTPAKDLARAIFASMGLSPFRSPYGNVYERHQQQHHDVGRDEEVEMKGGNGGNEDPLTDRRRSVKRNGGGGNSGTVPGICGLLNIGNTCFMNCGLQCLSHTPLFRSYFLSGRYAAEINHENPLGTGGKLVFEFAQLLKLIWGGNNVHVSPSKFKRALEKCKPIFAGHDQQDAQEFLSEMLDTLHEDVNRVMTKPLIAAPEDGVWDSMTCAEQAENAWQRHLARNRSVLVDLFQGQLMSEVTCQACQKTSRTFDPFMLLSVPLPKSSELQLSVLLVRTMPHFPRMPFKAFTAGEDYDEEKFIQLIRERTAVTRYYVSVPKLGDIGDVKKSLSKVSGVDALHLIVTECVDGRMSRICDDRDSVSVLHDFAYTCSKLSQNPNPRYPCEDTFLTVAVESVKDMSYVSALSGKALAQRSGLMRASGRPSGTSGGSRSRSGSGASSTAGSVTTNGCASGGGDKLVKPYLMSEDAARRLHLDFFGPVEYGSFGGDCREGDLIVDLEHAKNHCRAYPNTFKEFSVGVRLDALDHKGQWYPGQIVAIQKVPSRSLGRADDREVQIRVHFDNFAAKWDEIYNERDFEDGRLAPIYTRTQRKLRVLDVVVINRTYPQGYSAASGGATATSSVGCYKSGANPDDEMDTLGLPWMLQVENFRSCEHVYRLIVEQALRFLTNAELAELRSQGFFARESVMGGPDTVGSWIDTNKLPFTLRVVTFADPGCLPRDGAEKEFGCKEIEGTAFPRDPDRPIVNLFWSKMQIAVDWQHPRCIGPSGDMPLRGGIMLDDEAHSAAAVSMMQKISAAGGLDDSNQVSLVECLESFTREEELDDGAWYCSGCKTHQRGKMTQRLYQLPDVLVIHIKRFNMTARFREKIRVKVAYPLKGLDMSAFSAHKSEQRGSANLGYPASVSDGNDVYDLYGVSNHIGGMNGGHYTAFVRFSSTDIDFDNLCCSGQGLGGVDNAETNPTWKQTGSPVSGGSTAFTGKDKWLFFDDDYVEEVPADKVVTELAYVLFYKRRQLTPSNIINMTI